MSMLLDTTDIKISNELVTLEVDSLAETVVEVGEVELKVDPLAETVVEVGEVELEIAPFAETVVEVGVGDIVEVEADSTGLPEVEVFGLDVTELANPSAIGTLAFLAGFFGFV
ncbi:MAG: hypothetical protein QNJ18_02200 [Xenococcaceae cyanobacterium MO_167.B52]|nr:hypothetical protein [Xenococcaceae cyanobacterium MO_167.B52]